MVDIVLRLQFEVYLHAKVGAGRCASYQQAVAVVVWHIVHYAVGEERHLNMLKVLCGLDVQVAVEWLHVALEQRVGVVLR